MAPAPLVTRAVEPPELRGRCGICQTAFAPDESVGPCPSCGATFHPECWDENGGCAVYGCALAPAAVAAPAAPPSVWGEEDRDCPACGRRIKMAARRCVHCASAVAAGGPDALPGRPVVQGRGPAILLFAAALVPFTAPLALVIGGLWLWARRGALRRWPSGVRVLAIAGVVAAAAVTLVTVVGLAVLRLTGGGGEE